MDDFLRMDRSRILLVIWSMVYLLTVVSIVRSDIDRCPSNLPRTDYLKAFKEKCYEFHNEERSWYSARDVCHSRGGWLVQLFDWQIQSFIHNSLLSLNWNRNGVWIGAHDLDNEGDWKWVQGYPLTFTNWAHDQPGGCKIIVICVEDCANLRLDDNGQWHDYPCDVEPYSYICEYPVLPKTTTTTTSTTTTTTTTPSPTTRTTTLTMTSTNSSTSWQSMSITTSTALPTSSTPPQTTSTTPGVTTTPPSPSQSTSGPTQSDTVTTRTTPVQSTTTTRATTTTGLGDGGQILQQNQGEQNGGLSHGEVAALALSLLLIAFLSGVVCTHLLIKKRRKKKRLSTEGPGSAHYIVDPSRQPHVDEARLVLNILYNATVPDSPPKYEEIDHSTGTKDRPTLRNDHGFSASGFSNNNENSLAGRPPSYTSDTCGEKSLYPYYDTADGMLQHEKFSKSSSPSGSLLHPKGAGLEKSEGKETMTFPDDSYETPRSCSHLYRKVIKKQQTTDAATSQYDVPSIDNQLEDDVEYDDAYPKEDEDDDRSIDDQNVYCTMVDVNKPESETGNLTDSVYEEPISVKDLKSADKSKDLSDTDDQTYVQSDSVTAPMESGDDYLMVCEDVVPRETIQGIDNPVYSGDSAYF